MRSGEGRYPENIEFPEYISTFGDVSFDFVDLLHSFVIAFSTHSYMGINSFFEGSIDIVTNPDDFELDKESICRIIIAEINMLHKSGAALQKSIIEQLRLKFSKVNVDDFLQSALES